MVADERGPRTLRFVADEADAGARVDHFLVARADELSRSQAKRLIDDGLVTIDGAVVAKTSRKVRAGETVEARLPEPEPTEVVPEAIDLSILFEDEHIVVVDKPAGMVVHPAPGHSSGTLVNALLHHCTDLSGIGGELRPGIVHRIDKDTSGILVVTKSDAAHRAMGDQFRNKEPDRTYVAVVAPAPRSGRGTFETLHGRHPVHRKKFSSRVKRGRTAVTHYRVSERFGGLAAQLSVTLETGRTHQIRVHFSDAGMPLIGDPLYGRRKHGPVGELAARLGRQALHAAALGFAHPISGQRLDFESSLPDDLQTLLADLGDLTRD